MSVTQSGTALPKPIPVPDDATLPYWQAASEERLVVQQCATCGTVQHPPEVVCSTCLGESFRFKEVSGQGTVYTFIIVRQALDILFPDVVPYVAAWVDLDDEPNARLIANISGVQPEEVYVGMPVEVYFEPRGEWKLPQFTPRASAEATEVAR